MTFTVCIFGFSLVFLAIPISEARELPSVGRLDEMPRNCSNLTFCLEKHEKYPQPLIDALLINKYRLTLGSPHEETGERGAETKQSDLCEITFTHGPIYEIVDENDNVRVVVQSENLFRQQLRIEQCVSRSPRPWAMSSTEMEENTFECYEKKIDYEFLVLTLDGTGVEHVKSKDGIPVCCSCRWVYDYEEYY